MFEFCQELLVHLFNLPATLAWCSAHQGRLFLNLEEGILENQPAILLIASAWTDQNLFSKGPGLLSCYLFCSFLIPSWIPSSHGHCSHDCSSLHIPGHFFLIFKYETKQSIFLYCFLNHPCQEATIRVLQRPPGLLVLALLQHECCL